MFRRWLSGFIKNNKEKIKVVLKILLVVALILIALRVLFSVLNNQENNVTYEAPDTYEPTHSVITSSTVEQEEYEEDDNIVDTFIGFCNDGDAESAYNLLTDNCKKVLYPTLEEFSEKYCEKYFTEKRDYNLQAWVDNGNYTTYRLRITDDMLSTGNYDDSEKYQDYITIVNNNGEKKININSFIDTNEINKTTEKDGISIKVNSVNTFVDHQEYTLEIVNNTSNIIMLDDMKNPNKTIRVSSRDGFDYGVKINSVNPIKLRLVSGQTKIIDLNFEKKYTSGGQAQYINFTKVINNYDEYVANEEAYQGFTEMNVAL